MKTYKIYSGGVFKTTKNALVVRNPYNNKVIAETYLAGKDELEESIVKGLEAEKKMKELPVFAKYEILMQIANGIKIQRDHLASVLSMEAGKPLRYALGEIDRAVQTFTIAAEECKRLPKEYISLDWTAAGRGKEGLVKHFPIGLIAGIAPFNFPLNLAVHKIAPAIAAGNPIILKPARATPLSLLELSEIIDKTDLPKGAVSILPTDRETGNQLVTDERFKMLTFTGSPAVGWTMRQDAGRKKVTLELGGNAGVVVTESCDLDHAVKRCLIGGFAYSGQVCIHVQRIYVQNEIFDKFADKFAREVEKLKVGDPADAETEISVMIDENNAKRVENWIKEATEAGARLICGGTRKGTYFSPTVITNTKREMKVCNLEIFGPVVTLERFDTFDNAIDMINDSIYGLQAGVFTNNAKEINYAFENIEAGGVIINDVPTFRVDQMPYGGVKNSGVGREGVKYAIHEMMEPKLLVKEI